MVLVQSPCHRRGDDSEGLATECLLEGLEILRGGPPGPDERIDFSLDAATNAAPQPPGRPASPWRALDGELSARGSRSPAHSRFLVGGTRRRRPRPPRRRRKTRPRAARTRRPPARGEGDREATNENKDDTAAGGAARGYAEAGNDMRGLRPHPQVHGVRVHTEGRRAGATEHACSQQRGGEPDEGLGHFGCVRGPVPVSSVFSGGCRKVWGPRCALTA